MKTVKLVDSFQNVVSPSLGCLTVTKDSYITRLSFFFVLITLGCRLGVLMNDFAALLWTWSNMSSDAKSEALDLLRELVVLEKTSELPCAVGGPLRSGSAQTQDPDRLGLAP